jgi:hypothetical protein
MLTFEQAKETVIAKLSLVSDDFVILDHMTLEKPYAWIFFYTSKLWWETQDDKHIMAGNAPVIVNKQTGKHTQYSTAYGVDTIVEMYEEQEKIWSLVLADITSLDDKKLLLLKERLNWSYEKLKQIKNERDKSIDKGSYIRLTSLQSELREIGVVTLLWSGVITDQ